MKSGDNRRVHVKVPRRRQGAHPDFRGDRDRTAPRRVARLVHGAQGSFGQGVERIFPLHSPTIAKVDLVRSARVRRAKLYFLRSLKGKAARMKETARKTQ